jgi:two-component system, cell cycle sensor histidine kinase and response regulator CckA
MASDLLERKIRALQQQVMALQESGGTGEEALLASLSELGTAIEELWSSSEELRRQSEELAEIHRAASAERQRYLELLDAIPQACVVTDVTGDILEVNAAAEGLFQHARASLTRKPLSVFVHPSDLQGFNGSLHGAAGGAPPSSVELRILPRDRGAVKVRGRVSAVRIGGATAGVRWLLERPAVENDADDAQGRREATYRTMVERTVDVMAVLDSELRIRFGSPSLERLLGCSPDEYLGRPFLDLAHPEEAAAVVAGLRAVLREQDTARSFEQRLRHRHGGFVVVHTVATSMFSEWGEAGVLVTCRDATEIKQAEQLRWEKVKSESLGILAAGVAHDFNNLLQVILGRINLSLRRLAPDSPARPALGQAEVAVRRASELAGDMLTYSGQRHYDMQPRDLSSVLRSYRAHYDATVPARLRFVWNLAETLPPVLVDPEPIREAVRHLIHNAAEAIGERSGTIRVSTRLGELPATSRAFGHLSADHLPGGPHVLCEVCDDGPGMDEETRSRVFDPFYSTKSTGRGLGLSAVLGIMRGHHGGVAVETWRGTGTAVTLAFPVTQRPAAEAPPLPRVRGRNVLVVDDDDLVRELLVDLLTEEGVGVVSAASGAEALSLYSPDEFGLVLLDLTMPGMGGEETLRELRRIDPGTPVVLCSGYACETATRSFEGLDLAGFLQKPYDPALLMEVVRRELRRSGGR